MDLVLAGYPDTQSASTCVQLVKQQFTVGVPSTVTTGNWDCQITSFPNAYQAAYFQGTVSGNNNLGSSTPSVATNYFGGVVATAGATGTPLFPQGSVAEDASVRVVGSANYSSYTRGKYRVIAQAFEVYNTTAELYKQGQVTYFRQPTADTLTAYNTPVTIGANFATITVPAKQLRMPPATLAAAQLLYGSRTCDAAGGAYIVSRLNSVDLPLVNASGIQTTYASYDNPVGQLPITSNYIAAFPNIGTAAGVQTSIIWATPNDKVESFDISGAYFSGLSQQTTLVINCRWLIERCPNPDEFELVVLATPSPCYDAIALEMYSQAMSNLPPGVPVDENPLGEWFQKVLDRVAQWAPRVGGALAVLHPLAAPAGQIVGKLAEKASKALPKSASNTVIKQR
jgi:hypothetical protein